MTQVIKREWEIAKTFIFEVDLRNGVIHIDWEDFERMAMEYNPSVLVKVDEEKSLGELAETALGKVLENLVGELAGLILVISFKKDEEIMMDELDEWNACLRRLIGEYVEIKWGLQESSDIEGRRSVMAFGFSKS